MEIAAVKCQFIVQPANFPSHHHTKPSSMPIESHPPCKFKSFHLHSDSFVEDNRKRCEKDLSVLRMQFVGFGFNFLLQHRCRFDSVSCKSLLCAGRFFTLAAMAWPLLCAKNVPWPLHKQSESLAYMYFYITLCAYCVFGQTTVMMQQKQN